MTKRKAKELKEDRGRLVAKELKLKRLQLWLDHCDAYRARTGGRDPPKADFERSNGWTPHTVRRLMNEKEALEGMEADQAKKRYRVVKRPLYAVEAVLVDLIKDIRSRRLPVDTILLRALAQDIYTILWNRLGFMPFQRPVFDSSWIEGFKEAWNLDNHKMEGEAGSVDMDAMAGDAERLNGIIAEYALDDVYNADESGLFLQTMSPWTMDFDQKAGTKSVSARVSILFCVNATGADKRKPFILSTSLPVGFKTDVGADLRSQVDVLSWKPDQDNEDGWGSDWREEGDKKRSRKGRPDYMTGGAFLAWLKHIQHDIEAKDSNRKILLLVDNHGSHTVAMRSSQDFPNIRVEALPTNSTSVTQPLDAGIIAVFKRHYRHHVASRAYENSLRADIKTTEEAVQVESDGNEEKEMKQDGLRTAEAPNTSKTSKKVMAKISNFQAWEAIAMAWSEVKPQSISNCFAHVPILNDGQKKELSSGDEIDPDVQMAIMDAREDIADRACLMDGSPRMPLEERFPGACGQGNSSLTPVTYTDTQRDYYTRLSALLDGSTSLNNAIQRMSTNKEFMECFDVEPRAVPFDDLFPDEDDTDDEDYGDGFTSMRQPGTAITSSQTLPLLDTPRPQSTMLFSTFSASDVLVLTEGATLLAPGTIVAPPGSVLLQRSLQTRHQSYAWPIDDIRPSDISDQDFLQYGEDGAWSEEKSEDERIDILTKAAEILQGDENKCLRHALDLAAEKLINPGIGVTNASLVKDYNTRERKKMKDIRV